EGRDLRARGAQPRRLERAAAHKTHPAEYFWTGDRQDVARHGLCDPHRRGARLHRHRHQAADAGVGFAARDRAWLHAGRLVDGGVPGARDLSRGVRFQPARRRPARRARPEVEALMALLEIRDLHLSMRSYDGEAQVLNGIDLALERGEIRGLVGETGCGKSLTGLSISRLVPTPPGRYAQGEIIFDGQNLMAVDDRAMRKLRGTRIGMIFQDPTTNLNPAFRVGEQMIDVALHAAAGDVDVLKVASTASLRDKRAAAHGLAVDMLRKVGIRDPETRVNDYPHQFSGGMRQRVLIAMALIGRPDLLIADEPTTALDVTVQSQILKLIRDLVAELDLAVLLITHNLGVVSQVCTHVSVMYAGNIVEDGEVRSVFRAPRHPYTRALLAAVPRAHLGRGALKGLPGVVPDLIKPPPGCRFEPRCPLAIPACTSGRPPSLSVGTGHQ